jgi:4-carboxymuconolactone decarboxylase
VARLEPLPVDQLTPEQKRIHDLVIGSRKKLGGPFAVLLRNPPLADAVRQVLHSMREHGTLDKRLYELLVLTVVRHWSASYAWAVHEAPARAAGLDGAVIDAILARRRPTFTKPDEQAIYEAATSLLEDKKLSDAAYANLIKQFRLDKTIDIIALVGLYCMISTVINGFEVPTPNGERPFQQG